MTAYASIDTVVEALRLGARTICSNPSHSMTGLTKSVSNQGGPTTHSQPVLTKLGGDKKAAAQALGGSLSSLSRQLGDLQDRRVT
jgi:hypothetical protein